MVVIDLAADENAQEIFETLNARGAQLTAADLIKNFVFQRLLETGIDVEDAYQRNWKEFETGFWENEVSVGRLRYSRSAIFLNHWLIARTGEEVVAREVFDRFKRFSDNEAGVPMPNLLEQIDFAAGQYRDFVTKAATPTGPFDRIALFGYRTGVLESEVIKPLVLCLRDPERAQIPEEQLIKALEVLESWMVRRMLVRATTKNYNQVVAELVALVRKSPAATVGDVIEKYFAGQTSGSRYWPDDAEVQEEVKALQAYRRLGRGRLRMVLEALEDHKRGWIDGKLALSEERATRGKLAIEHIMPRKWHKNWPLQDGGSDTERDGIIHSLGNLTLLTGRLNSKVSNGPWAGNGGKRDALERHDVLHLNREIVKNAAWTDQAILHRTRDLANLLTQIWPVPPGHRSGFLRESPRHRKKVDLLDLINGGVLKAGMTLFPMRKKYADRLATLLPDGRIEVDTLPFAGPTEAATYIAGKRVKGGWWFFLADQPSKRSLRDVRREYVEAMAVEAEDDEPDEDGDGDDDEA